MKNVALSALSIGGCGKRKLSLLLSDFSIAAEGGGQVGGTVEGEAEPKSGAKDAEAERGARRGPRRSESKANTLAVGICWKGVVKVCSC